MIAQIFSFIGTLIYLELIELHFCEIDHNLKKNIKKRALEFEDENEDEEEHEGMELGNKLAGEEAANINSERSTY